MSKVGANTQTHRSSGAKIANIYRHDFRRHIRYRNCHVDKSKSYMNVIFKQPEKSYSDDYTQKVESGFFSETGLSEKGAQILTTLIDIESRYFDNDYEKAKRFFTIQYKKFCEKYGEENILGAVMHADETFTDDLTGKELTHYHLHIAHVPIATKEKRYSRATAKKNPDLYERDSSGNIIMVCETKKGREEWLPLTKVKSVLRQVSHTNCMKQRFDTENTSIAYERLQDWVWDAVRFEEEFSDVERGEHKRNRQEDDTLTYSNRKAREAKAKLVEQKETLERDLHGYDEVEEIEPDDIFALTDEYGNPYEPIPYHHEGLIERVESYRTVIKNVEQKLHNLQLQIEDKSQNVKLLEMKSERLTEEIEEKKEKLTELDTVAASKKAELDTLEQCIREQEPVAAQLESKVNNLQEQINEKQSILATLQEMIEKHLTQIGKVIKNFWHVCRTAMHQADTEPEKAEDTLTTGQNDAHMATQTIPRPIRQVVDESIDEEAEPIHDYINKKKGR